MKNRRSDREINNHYLNTGKADRVVQKSFSKEEKHLLRTVNGGFWNSVLLAFSKLLRFFFNNESLEGMRYFGPVLPDEITENNSGKRWYKTHVPKSMRKGLTHREVTTLRRQTNSKKIKYV